MKDCDTAEDYPSKLAEVLSNSFGLDTDHDLDEICALATTGYVVSCWRNTVLEDIHCGGFVPQGTRGTYARDGIPDRDMARLNVATWRQIRPHVTPDGIDVVKVRDLLRDKDRQVTIGTQTHSIGRLFAGTWTKLAWHLNEGAWLPLHVATSAFAGDETTTLWYYAVCGGSYALDWFGNPWWEAAISAWAEECDPPHAADFELARTKPNELDDEGVRWLMAGRYDQSFRQATATWQLEHGARRDTLGGGMWFPPGVPELPGRLK